jgi:hypothetical protein
MLRGFSPAPWPPAWTLAVFTGPVPGKIISPVVSTRRQLFLRFYVDM